MAAGSATESARLGADDPQGSMRALLPALHYLAAEATRSGAPMASIFIAEAIANIETLLHHGDDHDQHAHRD